MATLKVEQQFFFRHIKVDMKKKGIFFVENSFGPDLAQAFKLLLLSHVEIYVITSFLALLSIKAKYC